MATESEKPEEEADEYSRKTMKRYTGKLKWLDSQGFGYVLSDQDPSIELLVTPSSLSSAASTADDGGGVPAATGPAVYEGDRVEFGVMTRSSIPRFMAVDVVPFGPRCYSCERIGHYASNCPVTYVSTIECFRCGIVGHFARDCWAAPELRGPRRSRGRGRVRSFIGGGGGSGSGGNGSGGGGSIWGRVSSFTSGGGGGGGGDRRSIGGSVVCVKRREDVKEVEAVEDCFILDFDPTESRIPGGDDDGRKVDGSVVCVKREEDVKKVEEVEDCFILEFDPRETRSRGKNVVVDDGRKVNGSVLCVKRKEDVKKVEEVEDCFILDFDPNIIINEYEYSDTEEEDDDDDDDEEEEDDYCEEIRSVVCVKKVEDVKKVEEVEDCFILEFDPDEPVKFSNLSLSASTSELLTMLEEDVSIVAVKGQVACRDYPHPRHHCAAHPFKTTSHAVHCKMCYCYICDVPAPCAHWTEGLMHCHATDEIPLWRTRRDMEKNVKMP